MRNETVNKIFPSFFIKALAKSYTFGFLLVIVMFSSPSCSLPRKTCVTLQKYGITEEERSWLQEFFRDLLFESPGAYTLYGTKPMSISALENLTLEQKQKTWEMYQDLSEEEKVKYTIRRYDFDVNYTKWIKIKDRFPITQYLFGAFISPYVEQKTLILFINIEMTVKTLLENYEYFRSALGEEFDPLDVVFEVENANSSFWNKVIRNHELLGILLGFGKTNSWYFDWNMRHGQERSKKSAFVRSIRNNFDLKYIEDYNPENFSLPTFVHFGFHPDQPVTEKYNREREKIKVLYKEKDEVDLALEWLTRI